MDCLDRVLKQFFIFSNQFFLLGRLATWLCFYLFFFQIIIFRFLCFFYFLLLINFGRMVGDFFFLGGEGGICNVEEELARGGVVMSESNCCIFFLCFSFPFGLIMCYANYLCYLIFLEKKNCKIYRNLYASSIVYLNSD